MPTALLIDDEQPEVEALARSFRAHDWDVVTASDGTRAVALARERVFDVIVSDVIMEGLVGTALLQAIRATRGGGDAAFVFTSAMPERRVRRIIEGEYAFVAKPATFEDVMMTGALDTPARGSRHVDIADRRASA